MVLALVASGIAAAGVALLAALRRSVAVIEVSGLSMAPTLKPGDRVLLRRARPGRARVRAGDLVVLALLAEEHLVIKRVAAAPGDPIPPALAGAVPAGLPGALVPVGSLLVLGDNPAASTDSRQWGYLPVHRVRGVVRRRLPSAMRHQ